MSLPRPCVILPALPDTASPDFNWSMDLVLMEMMLFSIFAALALGSAVVVVQHRDPLRSMRALLVTLAATAVLFLTLAAPWLAVLQILAYSLAVLVLALSSRKLRALGNSSIRVDHASTTRFSAAVLTLAFATLLGALLGGAQGNTLPAELLTEPGSLAARAQTLFSSHLLLFGMVGFLVLVATLGARLGARRSIEKAS